MSAHLIRRLALGTVQFGQHYGIANRSGQVGSAQAQAILKRAAAAGMDTLDTAIAYGSSEECLGRAGIAGWRAITKLPPLPPDAVDVARWVEQEINRSMKRLGVDQLEAVLLHRSADVLDARGSDCRQALAALKSSGLTRALGVSIYDPSELQSLWSVWRPDLVQAPCSVLDRRLARSGWLSKLSSSGVRIHVRSVFLQGLLLMPAPERPHSFSRWQAVLDRWSQWCAQQGTSPLRAALAFALSQPEIERVVVGVDSEAQLQEILAAAAASAPLAPTDLFSDDRDLLEPARWKVA